jgi:hypothetical protein
MLIEGPDSLAFAWLAAIMFSACSVVSAMQASPFWRRLLLVFDNCGPLEVTKLPHYWR